MLPAIQFPSKAAWHVPDETECVRLWDKFGMLPNIREHCRSVAGIACEIVRRAIDLGLVPSERLLSEPLALAAGLLHDIAKTYTIRHGGSHAQLGAAWVKEETGNYLLAQAVLFHVSWPWQEGDLDDVLDPLRLPVIVAYADKRVRHADVVSLKERFDDLVVRYGISPEKIAVIKGYYTHTQAIEKAIFDRIGVL
ncbi:MAG: HDIG domain-containing protein [Mailhella sp.]|nr:HDIG domain-containing protein [Mailhella sp.]